MAAVGRRASLASRKPPGRSSCAQLRRVCRIDGVACSTLVAITRSNWFEAKPCSLGSASILSSAYWTNGYSAKRSRAILRKDSDRSVKAYAEQWLPSTGSTLAAVPPVPAPTSQTRNLTPLGKNERIACTACTRHALHSTDGVASWYQPRVSSIEPPGKSSSWCASSPRSTAASLGPHRSTRASSGASSGYVIRNESASSGGQLGSGCLEHHAWSCFCPSRGTASAAGTTSSILCAYWIARRSSASD